MYTIQYFPLTHTQHVCVCTPCYTYTYTYLYSPFQVTLLANTIEQFTHMIFKRDQVNAYVQCFNVLNNYLSMPLALPNDLRRQIMLCY